MGVHIFDTPYAALNLDVPETIMAKCRKPTGFGHPEHNIVTYEFPGTEYTTDQLKWVWYDGPGAPKKHAELKLPEKEELPSQGAMFIGEKGNLLLPYWDYPKLIVNGKYQPIEFPLMDETGHYHQFIDTCLGKDECSASFSYAARLTESILLGVIANRFPKEILHWNIQTANFKEEKSNRLLDFSYCNVSST